MNKTYLIAALMLAGLLVAGCTSQQPAGSATPTPGASVAATPTPTVVPAGAAVSQGDLDALRQDIESRQYDDLQGLS